MYTLKKFGFRIIDRQFSRYVLTRNDGAYFVEYGPYGWCAWHEDVNGIRDADVAYGQAPMAAFEELLKKVEFYWVIKAQEASMFLMDIEMERKGINSAEDFFKMNAG